MNTIKIETNTWRYNWWLRSPHILYTVGVGYIHRQGMIGEDYCRHYSGIVPICILNLN